jgi:mono/diheme cytochrome c family protein
MFRLIFVPALALLIASPAVAQSYDPSVGSGNTALSMALPSPDSPAARRGLAFVRANCGHCHAVDRASASTVTAARPLHALQVRYAVADLQRPLAEGVHPMMPVFRLTAGQVADVMAYLRTLDP